MRKKNPQQRTRSKGIRSSESQLDLTNKHSTHTGLTKTVCRVMRHSGNVPGAVESFVFVDPSGRRTPGKFIKSCGAPSPVPRTHIVWSRCEQTCLPLAGPRLLCTYSPPIKHPCRPPGRERFVPTKLWGLFCIQFQPSNSSKVIITRIACLLGTP